MHFHLHKAALLKSSSESGEGKEKKGRKLSNGVASHCDTSRLAASLKDGIMAQTETGGSGRDTDGGCGHHSFVQATNQRQEGDAQRRSY